MSAAATAAGYLYASGRLRKTKQGSDHYVKMGTPLVKHPLEEMPKMAPSGRPILGLPKRK